MLLHSGSALVPTPDLRPLFEPRGVVVVGASSHPDKLGFAMASSLTTFGGAVGLVNSRPSPGIHLTVGDAVAAADSDVDLAIMCVPAARTAEALRESAAAGIRAALVCSGGFAEIGEAGWANAADVNDVVAETGLRLLGPNTSGFFVPADSLFASFVPGVRGIGAGSIAIVAASGGINHVLAFQLAESGLGVSVGVGIGAGGDVTAADVLEYLAGHDATTAIILHIESVPNGRALLAAIERAVATKPVVALVVGRNDVSGFAQSHTGALATSWRTTRAALRQAGAVIVDDEEHAIAAVTALSRRRARPSADPGVALVTGQAGPGLIIADSLGTAGVALPTLSGSTRHRLSELLPPMTFQENPVDTGRPSATFPGVLRAVADDPAIDVVGVYAITEPILDLVAAVREAGIEPSTPVVVAVDGPADAVQHARTSAALAGIALLRGPTRLAQALAALAEDSRLQAERARDATPETAQVPPIEWDGEWDGEWDEVRGKDLLDALGIATPNRARCDDRPSAHEAFDRLRHPVAVKLVDASIEHKTDIGGVVLGINSGEALDSALDKLEAAGATQFLVEEMAAPGIDLVVGARVDEVFGPIVVLGVGGVNAEVISDVSIRTAPISASTAARMVDDLVSAQLLHGFRGGPVVDLDELGRVIATIGGLVNSGRVSEIEINPLRVTAAGLIALDAVVHPRTREQEGVNR